MIINTYIIVFIKKNGYIRDDFLYKAKQCAPDIEDGAY